MRLSKSSVRHFTLVVLASSALSGCVLDRMGTRPPCPAVGDHLYTTNLTERNSAVEVDDICAKYIDDGVPIAGYIFQERGVFDESSNTIPFYRLYKPSTGDHFYTTNMGERDAAISTHGYIDDNYCGIYESEGSGCVSVAGYVFRNHSQSGLAPLYRLYNSATGDHFYTTDWAERQKATQQHGYAEDGYCSIYEGGTNDCISIAGYIFSNPKDGTVPFYRLYRP